MRAEAFEGLTAEDLAAMCERYGVSLRSSIEPHGFAMVVVSNLGGRAYRGEGSTPARATAEALRAFFVGLHSSSEADRLFSIPISAVVGILMEVDPDGTWMSEEDEGALRQHCADLIETGLADGTLSPEMVRGMINGRSPERDVQHQAEARANFNRARLIEGHSLVWCGSSVECLLCSCSATLDADGVRGTLKVVGVCRSGKAFS